MYFLERIFGIALDGGNGSLELLLLAVPLLGIALLRVLHNRRQRA